MNCRRIEQLLPLYVEGDLKSSLTAQIASHLEWCGRCNWLADEFEESQSWLRSHEAPVFDEAFVGDLKRSVLNRVAASGSRASLFSSWITHWNRRQVLALAMTFLLVVGALTLYFYQSRARSNSDIVSGTSVPEDTIRKEDRQPSAANLDPEAGLKPKDLIVKGRLRFKPQIPRTAITRHDFDGRPPRTDEEVISQGNPTEQVDSSAGVPGDSREMLRIEIQTSDPNIRIIWFAPKEVNHQPTKPQTDTQQ
jgi:putative zinc finger protein